MDIYQTMINVMKDVDVIKKDNYNKIQKFKFRGIDDVYNVLHPICVKHGLLSVPTKVFDFTTEEKQTSNGGRLFFRMFTVEFTFYALDGTKITSQVRAEGMDTGDKASSKGMATAHKYALIQAFAIPTEESHNDDPDFTSVETVPDGTQMDKTAPVTDLEALQNEVTFELRKSNWPSAKKTYFEAQISSMHVNDLRVLLSNIKGGK